MIANQRLTWDDGSTARSLSGAATATTSAVYLPVNARLGSISADIVVTGTLAGTFTVETSNTPDSVVRKSGHNWVTYAPAGFTAPTISGAGTAQINISPRARAVRFKLVYTSGSGTIAADVTAT